MYGGVHCNDATVMESITMVSGMDWATGMPCVTVVGGMAFWKCSVQWYFNELH